MLERARSTKRQPLAEAESPPLLRPVGRGASRDGVVAIGLGGSGECARGRLHILGKGGLRVVFSFPSLEAWCAAPLMCLIPAPRRARLYTDHELMSTRIALVNSVSDRQLDNSV